MCAVNFEVIEGDGCGRMYSIHELAFRQIELLPPEEQEEIAAGIARAYGKVVRLLHDMSAVPFTPKSASIKLAALCGEHVIFDIGGFALKCQLHIVEDVLHLCVMSIAPQTSLASYQRHSLSENHR